MEPKGASQSNEDLRPQKLDPEKFLLAEYNHLLQEMGRYDNDSTKLSQLLGLLIFGTSFFSASAHAGVLFGFLPFLAVLAGFLLATNQFAYAAREIYVVQAEQMLRQFGLLAPCFYSLHAKQLWHSNRFTLNVFLPIRGAFLLINFLLLAVVCLGTWRTSSVLEAYDPFLCKAYWSAVAISLIWFAGSLYSGWHRLSQLHIKVTDDAGSQLGKLLG